MQAQYPQGPPPPPPPPPPPGTEPTIEPYRSPRSLALAVLVLLAIGLAVDLIGALSSVAEFSLLERAIEGELISFDEANDNDMRQATIAIAQLVIFIVTIIVFVVWFRRMYRNLPALGARGLRFTPGWAVGGWFVPFLNWVRPVQIMNDIWKASDPDSVEQPDTTWPSRPVTPLIGFWWASWILANLVGQYSFRVTTDTTDLEELQRVSIALIAADITSAVSTLFAMAVVWRTTTRQEARASRLSGAGNPI